MKGVGTLTVAAGVDALNQSVDQMGAELGCTVAQEPIEDFPAAHADVFVAVFKMDVHLPIGRGNHPHVAHFAVDDRFGQIELLNHAEGNRTTTGLGIVELALEQPGLDAGLGENFSSTRTAGAAAHDCHSQHLETCPAIEMWIGS